MTCHDVRRELAAYVDQELAGARRLLLSSHLQVCRECGQEETDLRDLGDLLRGSALPPPPMSDLDGLAGGVISRIGAEAQQSWRAKYARVFDDWHWVAVGGGACAAALVTVLAVFAMLWSPTAQVRQLNERVGTLYVMVLPESGAGGPVILEYGESLGAPSADQRYAVPASFGWKAEQALITALDASLMRHGGVVSLNDLSRADREEVEGLLKEISRLRETVPTFRPGGVTHVSGMHLRIDEVVTASGL